MACELPSNGSHKCAARQVVTAGKQTAPVKMPLVGWAAGALAVSILLNIKRVFLDRGVGAGEGREKAKVD